jgi:hypothetical protein
LEVFLQRVVVMVEELVQLLVVPVVQVVVEVIMLALQDQEIHLP